MQAHVNNPGLNKSRVVWIWQIAVNVVIPKNEESCRFQVRKECDSQCENRLA